MCLTKEIHEPGISNPNPSPQHKILYHVGLLGQFSACERHNRPIDLPNTSREYGRKIWGPNLGRKW